MRFIVERVVSNRKELTSVIAQSIEAARAHYKNCRIFKLNDSMSFEAAKEQFLKASKKPKAK